MRERAQDLSLWFYAVWVERFILAGLLVSNIIMGLGSAWDFHWHEAIGRDSFWIPPHMLIYTGTAVALALAFVVALRTGVEVRSASPLVMLQSLHSHGYSVVGIGGATMAGAAVFDEIWHRTIGDLTIWSPPHVLGVVGGIIIGLGIMIALLHASRRQTLPSSWCHVGVLGIMASVLIAGFFGLVPAAVMAFLPKGATYRFFTTQNPYFAAVVASLTIPAVVTGTQRLLGKRGFEAVVIVALGLWSMQEAFHQAATPLVAEQLGYVLRPSGFVDLRFELLVLGFMLLPPLVANRLAVSRPVPAGALMGVLYVAEVAIGLGLVQRMGNFPALPVVVMITLGAISAGLGILCGDWIGRVADVGNWDGSTSVSRE